MEKRKNFSHKILPAIKLFFSHLAVMIPLVVNIKAGSANV